MNINNLITSLTDENNDRFDDIKKLNKHNLDIDVLFNLENKTISEIASIKEKDQNLDLIYINYNKMKNNLKKNLNTKKSKLININNLKERYDINNLNKKLSYVYNEYKFYIKNTNTDNYMNNIKELHDKIEYLLKRISNKKIINKYEKIKNKYKNIIAFVKSEKLLNDTILDKRKDTSYKINWYNNRINEMIEKQMIFDSYMFLLESFYDELIKYEIDKIKN